MASFLFGPHTFTPTPRGKLHADGWHALTVARLPDDPIGTTNVTFSGVPAGSEIRIYDPNRNELAGIESCAANQVLSWPVYAAGSPLNTVRIVIVSTGYELLDFTYESSIGNKSIPIFQRRDKWYLNP